jgi:hypothetical protein
MGELPEYVDGLPNLSGSERLIDEAIATGRDQPVFLAPTSVDIAGIDSAFAVALHMHQPLILAAGPDLRTAATISNLQWMLEHPDLGDNQNAPAFHWCYKRMGSSSPSCSPRVASRGSCWSTPAPCCTGCDARAWTTWSMPCGP